MRLAAVLLLAALAVSGCGGTNGSGSSAGGKVFASAGCGTCHTLGAAGTKGQIGPNLDQLKPDYDTIVRQVSNGGNGMPAFGGKLSAEQIRKVAVFVSTSTKSSTASLIQFHPDKKKVADCHDFLCYQQAFGNVAYYHGPQAALSLLASDMRTNSTVNGDCHQIAHSIGHAAFARYHGDAAKALSQGAMTCWSGYYHGVIERAFGGVPRQQVAAKARTLCTGPAVNKNTFVLYQCVHGLGHGLMIYSGDDLPYALRVCDQLQTQWDRSSCTGGVFMQNLMPMAGIKTKWLRTGDLLYPCNVVAARDKLYCYLMSTSRILPAVGYNWHKAAAWCRRAEHGWVATCFQSFGRDASGQSVQNPPAIVAICRIAGTMERECIYGAARDLTSNDANGRRAARMCLLSPPGMRPYCFNGIGTILGGFKAEAAGRRAECAQVTPRRYLSDCYRGAAAF
ncbi:MAG: cytochrome c [Gaiellaceae bacterium]